MATLLRAAEVEAMSLRFHWMLPKGGEVKFDGRQTPLEAARYRIESMSTTSPAPKPDLKGWTHFAQCAEEAGIESVLISFSRYEPDPFLVSCALGQAVKKLKFIIAYRSGLMQPTTFVQQMNTVSATIPGRVAFNIVAGSSSEEQHGYGDFLSHDERYARAEEFLAVCNAFWRSPEEVNFDGTYYRVEQGKLATPFVAPSQTRPEIYVSGHSGRSEALAYSQGTCWLRVAEAPEKLAPIVARAREHGIGVCLRLCLLCRPTRDEAIAVAESLLPADRDESTTMLKDDSQMYREGKSVKSDGYWLTDWLWTGLVPHYGPVWTTLLGSPEEIAAALLEYERIGVTEFIISGWPEVETINTFGREIVPLVRRAEWKR
ncbi:MAG TPA: LLM class flavin-dependent oxidoreductase [Pyrinomonadaceae bacterium]|jgi:alkanesulfonate monooxygenase